MKKSLILFLLLAFGMNTFLLSQTLSDSVQLSEVIVSAEKKNQKIKDLPISVTSISMTRIESEKVKSLRNITSIVPNFYMPEYGSKLTSPVYIRGVGSRVNSPSVGLYVDRVPYFEKSAFAFDFADVERVEILRGPQGTLYGRNTMGGIINIVTRAPRNYRELKLSSDFGNYGFMKYNFLYNEPISKNLAVLINGGYTERDGFFTNQYHNESVGSDYTKNGSVKVRYNPIKPLVLTYKIGGERSYEKGYPYGVVDSTNEVRVISYNYKSRYYRDILDNSFTASLYLDKFVLTSVSGMQFLEDKQEIDQDFMPKDYYQVQQGVKQNQYTQEIVFTTNEAKRLDATVGVFGFIQNADRNIDLNYGADSKEVRLVPGNGYVKFNNEENSGMAIFGQATVKKIAGFIDITLGLRRDYEWSSLQYTYLTTQPTSEKLIKDTLYKELYKEWMPRVAVRFNITPNTSAFAIYSEGYRGGGFNTSDVLPLYVKYDAEESNNYEVGIKSTVIENKLSMSAALFYIDWKNQQVSQRVAVGGNMIQNAGASYSKGFEAEFLFKPVNNLQFGGTMGYTKAVYLEYKPNVQDELNYKGKYLPFIPRYTYSAFAGYKVDLKSKFFQSANIHLSAQGVGKQYWNDTNENKQDAFTIVNGSVGVEMPWVGISFWTKNLLNRDYFPYMFYVTNFKNWYAQKGHPFTFGVTLSVNISEKR